MTQVNNTLTGNNNDVSTYIVLYLRDRPYTISAGFYNAVQLQVEDNIPGMERGVKYTLEMLCGDVFWRTLSDGDTRKAGRCMADMVANNQFPQLRFIGCQHEHPKKYQLR